MGFIDRQRKDVGVGEEENRRFLFLALHAHSRTLASLAGVFEKNEKKNKTTSLYRLTFVDLTISTVKVTRFTRRSKIYTPKYFAEDFFV